MNEEKKIVTKIEAVENKKDLLPSQGNKVLSHHLPDDIAAVLNVKPGDRLAYQIKGDNVYLVNATRTLSIPTDLYDELMEVKSDHESDQEFIERVLREQIKKELN